MKALKDFLLENHLLLRLIQLETANIK